MNIKEEEAVDRTHKICQPNFAERWMDSCRKFLAQIENVKEQVKDEFRDRLGEHHHLLELAVNEAEALAWQTDFPQLFFPTLATEKARAVVGWHAQQRRLLGRSSLGRMAA